MSDVDVELQYWISGTAVAAPVPNTRIVPVSVLISLRDEIMDLRRERDHANQFVDRVKHLVAQARTEALYDAAEVCERTHCADGFAYAAAIRGLQS